MTDETMVGRRPECICRHEDLRLCSVGVGRICASMTNMHLGAGLDGSTSQSATIFSDAFASRLFWPFLSLEANQPPAVTLDLMPENAPSCAACIVPVHFISPFDRHLAQSAPLTYPSRHASRGPRTLCYHAPLAEWSQLFQSKWRKSSSPSISGNCMSASVPRNVSRLLGSLVAIAGALNEPVDG